MSAKKNMPNALNENALSFDSLLAKWNKLFTLESSAKEWTTFVKDGCAKILQLTPVRID